MKKSMKKTAAIGFTMTTLAMLLSGCGGGGGGGGFTGLGGSFFGHVADGSVSGAIVKFDINNSGVCGDTATENAPGQVTSTDPVGNFTYPNSAITQGKMICATGGIDISTGALFVGEMKAPGGSAQITPATTLVQAVIDAAPVGAKPTPAAAATTLANNLGLAGTNLLTDDPVALAATNPKLAQTTSAIQTMLLQIANNVAAAATNTLATPAQTAALYSSAVAGLATAIAPVVPLVVPAIVDLTNVTTTGTAAVDKMVNTAVIQTVTAVQAAIATPASNPTLAAAVTASFSATVPVGQIASPLQAFQAGTAAIVPANVAAVAAANITNVAQQVALIPAAILVSPPVPGTVSASLSAQTNTQGQMATATIASTGLLDTLNAATAGTPTKLAATAATTTTAVTATGANAASIQSAVSGAILTNSPAAVATTTPPMLLPPAVVFTNYLPIAGATVTGTGNCAGVLPVTAACPVVAGPVTVTGPITSTTLNFGTAAGTPVFAPTVNAVFTVTSTVPGDNRQFSGTISGLTLTGGVLTVPATATATVSGTHLNGTTASATATGTALIGTWVAGTVGSMGSVTLNVGKLLTDLGATATTGTAGALGFANLNLLKGNFSVDMTLNGAAIGNAVGFTQTQTVNVIVN